MSAINASQQAPIPVIPRRNMKTRLLNFFAGNPVRALFSSIAVWAVILIAVKVAFYG